MRDELIRKLKVFTGVLVIFLLAFTQITQAGVKNTGANNVKPVFGSSFIQCWYAQNWDKERWTKELKMLKNVGINEIIVQSTVDTKKKYAVYPTKMHEYSHSKTDMINNVLSCADKLHMNVRIGLGFNNDWWDKQATDAAWLNREAGINITVVEEIISKYGYHPSLGGWYLSYEFTQSTGKTAEEQSNLNKFLKDISHGIRSKSSKDIMIAPFYNSGSLRFSSLSNWSAMLQNVLKGTDISIIALQDSIGTGYNNTKNIQRLFFHTKKAADALKIRLYADTETFIHASPRNVPASQKRISTQLSTERPYVEGFVAFGIDHFQNENVSEQLGNYIDYLNYYLANK